MPLMKKSMKKMEMPDMDPGKSLSVALDIQKRTGKKPMKKMAMGGMAEATSEPAVPARKPDDMRLPEEQTMGDKWAKGGMVDTEDHYGSIADAILGKARKAKMMAEGGMADTEESAEESSPDLDDDGDINIKKELYDEDDAIGPQPTDSNEHDDDIDSDDDDMVSQIRKKYRAKQGM